MGGEDDKAAAGEVIGEEGQILRCISSKLTNSPAVHVSVAVVPVEEGNDRRRLVGAF